MGEFERTQEHRRKLDCKIFHSQSGEREMNEYLLGKVSGEDLERTEEKLTAM